MRDHHRSALYAAERMAFGVFDGAGPTRAARIGGVDITVPPEARFASIESICDYVDRVMAMPTVMARFPRSSAPVRVRARRGAAAATYEPGPDGGVIAIPETASGRWALRELVVLHELAHHLDDSGGAAHGAAFRGALVDLVGIVVGPEARHIYRVVFGQSGLPVR